MSGEGKLPASLAYALLLSGLLILAGGKSIVVHQLTFREAGQIGPSSSLDSPSLLPPKLRFTNLRGRVYRGHVNSTAKAGRELPD